VVRGGVEPPTFRFSEGLSRLVTAGPGDITSPSDQHMGLSEGYGAILTALSAIPRNAVSSVLSECCTSGGPDLCCSCVGARTPVPLSSGDIGPDPRGCYRDDLTVAFSRQRADTQAPTDVGRRVPRPAGRRPGLRIRAPGPPPAGQGCTPDWSGRPAIGSALTPARVITRRAGQRS
jgi:hypothetical protein